MRCFVAFVALSQIFGTRGFLNPIKRGRDGGIYFATSEDQLQAWNTDGSVKWTSQLHEVCEGDVTKIVKYDNGLDGTILVFTECLHRKQAGLYALNGLDGSIQWEHVPDVVWYCMGEPSPEIAVSDDTIYLQTVRSAIWGGQGAPLVQLEAIDAAGALKWAKFFRKSTMPLRTTLMVGPTGVFTGDEQFLSALSPENGSVRWTFAAASKMSNKYALAKNGGVFVTQSTTPPPPVPHCDFAKREGALDLLHLSSADGRVLWNVSGRFVSPDPCSNDPFAHAGAPILGSSGEVYVRDMMDSDGVCNTRAFDGEGNLLRVLPCHNFHHLTKQNEDGTTEDIFVALSEQFPLSVIAYSGASSHLLWNLELDTDITLRCRAFSCHLKAGENGTVFLVEPLDEPGRHWDEPSVAIAVRDGMEAWRTSVDWFGGDPGHMLMVEDGTTYNMHMTFKSGPGHLEALEALDAKGVQKWNFQLPVLI